ncbi:MAG TPA: hypothetical protein PLU87_03010 [Sedimentisphaerales bacterium]|nr:hypothetical protein [Sedimentisphaerales bacterium]
MISMTLPKASQPHAAMEVSTVIGEKSARKNTLSSIRMAWAYDKPVRIRTEAVSVPLLLSI